VLINPHALVQNTVGQIPQNDPSLPTTGLPARRSRRIGESRLGLPALIEAYIQAQTLEELEQMIPARVAENIGCSRVILHVVREDTLTMVSATPNVLSSGWSSTLLRIASIAPIPLTASVPETQALNGNRAVLVAATADTPSRIIVPLHGINTDMGVLVIVPTVGEISLGSDGIRPSHMFLIGIEDVARTTALLLESFHLLTENHQHIEEMNLLKRLTSILNNNVLDINAAIHTVEQQIIHITGADRCSVVLGTTAANRIQLPGNLWIPTEVMLILQGHGGYEYIPDVQQSYFSALLPENVRSFFTFPLLSEESVVGVLALGFHTHRVIETSERDLLAILANTASTILQRTRLSADANRARLQTRDMHERVRNEERVKDAILRTIQSGLVTIDLEGRITVANRVALEMLHVQEKDVLGLPIEEVLAITDQGPHLARIGLGVRMTMHRREVHVRTVDGQELQLDMTVGPLQQADGKEMGAICTFQDVTHLRVMENQVKQAEQIANVGTNASGISHDIINIANNIMLGMADISPTLMGNDAQLASSIIHNELKRLEVLAQNVMNLMKPDIIVPKACPAEQIFKEIIATIRLRTTMNPVSIVTNFEVGAILFVDEGHIKRALENLCLNAIEAMPHGGTLTIITRTTRGEPMVQMAEPPHVGATHASSEGQTDLFMPDYRQRAVEIVISDSGVGIPKERLQAIWEPFATFGKHRKGTGLGLAIVQKFIKAHGGTIEVASEVGKGTTFTIRLPGIRNEGISEVR